MLSKGGEDVKRLAEFIKGFFYEEDGIQTIEMVIILVVLVSIAFVFRKTMVQWYNELIGEAQRPDLGTPEVGKSLAE